MTLGQFKNEYPDIPALMNFQSHHDLYFDDMLLEYRDTALEYLEEEAMDTIRNCGIFDTRNWLDDIPDCDYYYKDSWSEWHDAEDFYDTLAEYIFDLANEDGIFDEEEDEDVSDSTVDCSSAVTYAWLKEEPIAEEEISMEELFKPMMIARE